MPPMRALRTWRPDDRLSCLAAYALILLWCFPLYSTAAGRGSIGSDWEWFLAYFEALRVTVIDHGQFPGLHVWNFLGSPFWANPQIGPVSHFGLLSLLLGPLWGIKLGMLVSYLLSFESARALGRELFETPAAAVCAGLLYALNTGLAAQLTRGQITFGGYFLAPLLVLSCLRLRHHRWAGASAGIVAGLCVHYGVSYFVIYTFFLCALLALATALRHRAWGPLLRFGGLFALAFVAVAAVRLLPMLAVLSDFPRELRVPLSLDGGALARMFLVPALGPPSAWLEIGDPRHPLAIGSWEFFAYCGMGVLALTAISLRWGVRFYHVGALLAFWLMLGARYPWQLSRWLSYVPPFHATWMPFRWRLVVLACLALAAAQGVDRLIRWSNTRPPHLRWGARALAWVLPLELIVLLLPSWAANITPYRHVALDRQDIGLPQTDHMLAVRHVLVPGTHKRLMYNLVRNNVGTVLGYDPLFGYGRIPTRRVFAGHPRYRGEYLLDGQPVVPRRWSPNRLVFADLRPGSTLEINLNPGRGWFLGGEPLFQGWKTFEFRRPFIVKVPPSGRVELSYRPPGLVWGFALSLLAGLALIGLRWVDRRSAQSRGSHRTHWAGC